MDTGLFGFEESTMGKTRVAYPPEFRRQMVELVRAAAASVRGSGRKNGSAGGRTKECHEPEDNMT